MEAGYKLRMAGEELLLIDSLNSVQVQGEALLLCLDKPHAGLGRSFLRALGIPEITAAGDSAYVGALRSDCRLLGILGPMFEKD